MIDFSIIMPVYNSAETLGNSIQSVLLQKKTNWELICVNDGSSDSSAEILDEFSKKFDKIKVLNQSNSGPGIARNNGIRAANGKYIAFLDSDDLWTPDFLQTINDSLEINATDIVFYDFAYCTPEGHVSKIEKLSRYKHKNKQELLELQMSGLLQWGMFKVIRRSLIVEHQILFGPSSVGEEAVFSFDALRFSKTFSFVEKPIYFYLQFSDSQHKKGNTDPWKETTLLMKKHLQDISLYKEYQNGLKSLALRACIISCYRCSLSFPLFEAIRTIHNKINEYVLAFDIRNMKTHKLDFQTKLIRLFICLNWALPVIFLSKLRKK